VKVHDEMQRRGIGLAAISVDAREESVELADKLGIHYPLLRDADLKVAMAYGVAMKGRDIAIPAVFVVSPSGAIVWKKVGESMTDRPSVDRIMEMAEGARAR
jgi:peroxiredoxin